MLYSQISSFSNYLESRNLLRYVELAFLNGFHRYEKLIFSNVFYLIGYVLTYIVSSIVD